LSRPALVLASRSPRRQQLLRSAGLCFQIAETDVAELDDGALGLAGLVTANARAKALAAASARPDAVVLGADTLVWLDGAPLGKPSCEQDAQAMLRRLSDRVHEVATGVHLARLDPDGHVGFCEVTRVRFRALDDAAIAAYMARVSVLDKAGAYALQEHGEMLVETVEGSRSNVVGLPMRRTLAALERHFGIVPD
jgi:septum formation protein